MKIKCLKCGTVADLENARHHRPAYCECGEVMIDDIGAGLVRVARDLETSEIVADDFND